MINMRRRCNIHWAFCVCRGKMERKYRVTGTMEQGAVLWFVNRSKEPGYYALDESFSRDEASRLDQLLKRRNLECRIKEVSRSVAAEQSASWNLLGRLIELEQAEAGRLPFRVVCCLRV